MSKSVKINVKLNRELIRRAVRNGGKKGTWMALDYLASESKKRVPLDQGPLMNSCAVDVNTDGTQGTVSYDTPYAVAQHENTQYHHQRGRQAKYLEDPSFDSGIQRKMTELAGQGLFAEME